ncbi:NAD(P)/FAD-dependent oxidoreductase [Streptomyces sp. NBC_00059]|uniref:NAD(P)/FAD-dependent oxidoreductase n=1 Tax=Streptomyces sp. NBC_00059 TaxID=2975635 RepID=UPI00224DC1B4|nr:FAD-dependent oxidoreductase [Streptomyces sp. NBC_00059]MCX5411002.1 FAD-dependent oxidoreductase [Streptomyces sp. NBC_00059]
MNTHQTQETVPHHIVVLGAGYAGMAAAVQLAARTGRMKNPATVTLVSAQERFTERLRLHMTATGQEVADLSIPEMLEGTGARFVRGWVTAVDAKARTVRIDDDRVLSYDNLVYALGGVADTAAVPGVEDHAFTLSGPEEAEALAGRLARLGSGTVLVAGSGLTGVESAAEIAERHPELDVVLVGRGEPGASMNPKARAYLQAALDRLGVAVRSGVEVAKVLPDAVVSADGEHIAADVVLWTSGTRVSPLAAAAGLEVDERGRIVTDTALRSVSHPEVYAVGDAAAVRQGYGVMHGTCQGGMPTGVHAALSIVRVLQGKQPEPFRFGYYHTPVSLGRDDAVVQFTRPDDSPRRIFLTGRTAARYKEVVTASPWPTYGRMKKMPASGAFWPRGGRFTRIQGDR